MAREMEPRHSLGGHDGHRVTGHQLDAEITLAERAAANAAIVEREEREVALQVVDLGPPAVPGHTDTLDQQHGGAGSGPRVGKVGSICANCRHARQAGAIALYSESRTAWEGKIVRSHARHDTHQYGTGR